MPVGKAGRSASRCLRRVSRRPVSIGTDTSEVDSVAGPFRTPVPQLPGGAPWPTLPPCPADSSSPISSPAPGVRDAALVAGGAGLTGLAAQVSIHTPLSPVPFTLQTLAVLVVGAALGSARGVLSMLVYALAGVCRRAVVRRPHQRLGRPVVRLHRRLRRGRRASWANSPGAAPTGTSPPPWA